MVFNEWLKDIEIINDLERKNGELLVEITNLKLFAKFIKENLNIKFFHTKHSRYYTIHIANRLIIVSKEKYYRLKEVIENE